MTKKRPLKEEDDPDKRLRYEEAALESLKRQVVEKEELVRSLRKEVYARRTPRSVKELETKKPAIRDHFVAWTPAQVQEAIDEKEGHRNRKRIRLLRRCWGSDLATAGEWPALCIAMLHALQACLPLGIALIDLVM